MGILCAALTVFLVVLFARAVFSWFPIRPGTTTAQINRVLIDLTEWALRPLRKIIPPAGMFDLAFLVLLLAVVLVRAYAC